MTVQYLKECLDMVHALGGNIFTLVPSEVGKIVAMSDKDTEWAWAVEGIKKVDDHAQKLGIRIGLGWAKSHTFATGQCPVIRYNRQLMQAILYDKIQIAKAVNVDTITLDDAPRGYENFDKGAAKKYVIDPHKMVANA